MDKEKKPEARIILGQKNRKMETNPVKLVLMRQAQTRLFAGQSKILSQHTK